MANREEQFIPDEEQFLPVIRPEGTPFFDDVAFGMPSQMRRAKLTPAGDNWKPNPNTVVLAVVSLDSISNAAYWYHTVFMYRCGRRCQEYEFRIGSVTRAEIDRARNYLLSSAIAEHCEFLFFYDTDTHLHPDLMSRFLQVMRDHPDVMVVSPLYRIRGYPFEMMAFDSGGIKAQTVSKKELLKRADDDGLADVGVVGNGCTLIRVEAAASWDGPWFKTGPGHTEDAYFCTVLRNQMPKARVVVDTTISCGHELAEPMVVWEETVDGLNKAMNPKNGWHFRAPI